RADLLDTRAGLEPAPDRVCERRLGRLAERRADLRRRVGHERRQHDAEAAQRLRERIEHGVQARLLRRVLLQLPRRAGVVVARDARLPRSLARSALRRATSASSEKSASRPNTISRMMK